MAKWGEGDPRWIVEERPDATNVNNWHWSEKNACLWSKTKIKELLQDLKVENSEGTCQVSEVSKCEGEAVVNNRKGRLIFFYDWSIELKWKATSTSSEPKSLNANGKVIIPNLSEENDISEVEITSSVDESTDFGYNMKTLMNKQGSKLIREKLTEYLEALKKEYSQGLILPSKEPCADDKSSAVSTNHVAPVKPSPHSQITGAVQDLKLDSVSFSTKETLFCPVDEAFKCFTDQKMVQAYTRGPVILDTKPGGKFALFNNNITGEFIELVVNKRLKQWWRNESWRKGHRSIVELSFEQTNDGTVVSLTQSGIPASELESTKEGWNNYYWRSIKQTFGFGSFLSDVL